MSRKRKHKKQKREKKNNVRRKVSAAVASAFPDCVAEFGGGVGTSRMARRGPTFGFRVKHSQSGKYRSNQIWLNPTYSGDISADDVRLWVKESNN